jgi:hypothetical protein
MTVDIAVQIPLEEWETASWLLRFVDRDEGNVLGMLRLRSNGEQRQWCAMDERTIAVDLGGSDSATYEVLVSPRLVVAGLSMARRNGHAWLTTRRLGEAAGEIQVSDGVRTLRLAPDYSEYPDVAAVLDEIQDIAVATARVDGRDLDELASNAGWNPFSHKPDAVAPPLRITVDNGVLSLRVTYRSLGFTEYQLAAETVGEASGFVMLHQFIVAVDGADGLVEISVPQDGSSVFQLRTDSRLVLMRGGESDLDLVRQRVEPVLETVFGPDALKRDADDDYPLPSPGTRIYARVVEDRPPRVQVFAVVLVEVDGTPELYSELNDHNTQLGFVRSIFLNGAVVVEADLVAESLDPREIETAYARVKAAAEELGPMIAAVHGGTLTAHLNPASADTPNDESGETQPAAVDESEAGTTDTGTNDTGANDTGTNDAEI